MSQYTQSLNAIINIYSGKYIIDFKEKIEKGKKILFNFTMPIDDDYFINLFENQFILQYIERNICYNTCDRWLLQLENDVIIKMPLFYEKYSIIKNLKQSDILTGDSNVVVSESTGIIDNSKNEKGKGKNISSDYPQEIPEATSISNVRYMNNGGMNEEELTATANQQSKDKSTTTSTSTLNKLDRLDLYEKQLKDIIKEFVDSFEDLFLFLY